MTLDRLTRRTTVSRMPIWVNWVKCCRAWPVVAGSPVRRCGLCGEVPIHNPTQGES